MRFTVLGTDAAGLSMEFTIEARGVEEAEHLARQRGINVVKIHLSGPAAGAEPGAAAPPSVLGRTTSAAAPVAASGRAAAPVRPQPASAVIGGAQRPEIAALGRRVNLGLVSLAVAAMALVFCWIPTVGLISLPLCVIGVVAGVAGLLAAVVSRGTSRAAGQVASPIAGLALSGAAMAATVMLATGPATPDGGSSAAAPVIPTSPVEEKPTGPAKVLTIVASNESHAPRGFETGPKAQPELQPAAADQSLKMGNAEVRVISSSIMPTPLISDRGRSAGVTAQPLMVLRVEVRNTGTTPLEYRTFAGDGSALSDSATLLDGAGRALRRAKFDMGIVPVGRVMHETVAPGRSVIDVLAFDQPMGESTTFTLTLPGACVGVSGREMLKFSSAKP